MRKRKIVSLLMASTMVMSFAAGCGNSSSTSDKADAGSSKEKDYITEFTAFFAVPGSEINDDNEIQQIIAEKTGVKVKETWLTGQTAEEAIGTLIAGGEYPDFIEG